MEAVVRMDLRDTLKQINERSEGKLILPINQLIITILIND